MIEIKGLKKSFGKHEVLRGIDLTIQDKEVVVIIGPSGSGKSTILRCINYLEEPTAGEIIVDGISMNDAKSINSVRKEVGMVFQRFNLFPHMTVLENIILSPMKTRGESKEAATEVALQLLEKVGLADKKDAYPETLSGGQQQRVAIARALVLRPAVLLLDEPFSALDAKIRGQMREELKRIQREAGLTVIFVTHDQEEAMAISDRIAVMNQGAIEQLDSPTEIYDNPHSRFVAGFIGEMNFLDEGGAVLAVRPEDIALRSASGAGMARIESVMPLGHYTQIILVRADGARLKVFIPKEQALGYIPGQTADYSFTRFKQFGAAQASA